MIHITTWLWGTKYGPEYIQRLRAGVTRHMTQEHRFLVCNPTRADLPLTHIPGCFARLRAFDPAWQARQGIKPGERIVCLDLDLIVTGGLDAVFDRDEPFVILQGANSANPCPYNGSVWQLRAGYRPDVWFDFSLASAAEMPFFEFPEDQAWFHHKMPGAAGWRAGQDGVYAMGKPGWPKGTALPPDARIVAFPGRRDPSQFTHLDWVKRHWC